MTGQHYVLAQGAPCDRSTTAVRQDRAPNNTAPTAFPDSVLYRHVFTFLRVVAELAGAPCTVTATHSVTRFAGALTQCEFRPLASYRQGPSTVPSTGLRFHTVARSTALAGTRTTSLPVHHTCQSHTHHACVAELTHLALSCVNLACDLASDLASVCHLWAVGCLYGLACQCATQLRESGSG